MPKNVMIHVQHISNMKNKLLNDPKVAVFLYFKYSKNTPWITSEELVNRVKRYINGKG